jgi:hypothetical protein
VLGCDDQSAEIGTAAINNIRLFAIDHDPQGADHVAPQGVRG